MVDHGACITGACDLYHLPIQSIWMPGFEVHTYCMADHWGCITGAICRMLCDGWVQRIPDHLNIVFSAASTAQRRSCRDVKGSEKHTHADSKVRCQLQQDWYRTRKLVAIFVTSWARVRNYHIWVYLKFVLLKSPEIACSHEVPDFSLFDTKINSKDEDPELVQSKSCEMNQWQT